ncbi:hypothetical protein J6595_20215 [Jiella sp. KSK16Y-1]|uniref:Uncharacterized protein n=2 Tax=Jiella mangrovi TaxID=2821407 RepID=A0ABS4BME7_9HYPH|nr:hypothetical protein [Jiella mangrovi]
MGLFVLFLNTDRGVSIGERLKRAAETGAVFSEPAASSSANRSALDALQPSPEGEAGEGPKVAPLASDRLLMPPATKIAEDFVRLATVSPKRICRAIDPGQRLMKWSESPLMRGQWECYATATADGERVTSERDLEDEPATEDPDTVIEPSLPTEPQLFVMARGVARDTLTSIRIKLVADSGAKAKRGAKRLAELTAALFDVLQWSPPGGLLEKLRNLQDFEIDQAGTRLRFKRELSAGWQYNLIVIFPNAIKYRKGSAFQGPQPEPSPLPQPPGDPSVDAPAGDR